jgi:RNA polymerase sigma-70 factor, ECF subfamily
MNRRAHFEQQVMPHLDAAYNLARWLTRNDHDAEDVVQESFMRAMKYFDGMRGTEARPWLLTIVRNTCYTWLEKNRPADLTPIDENNLASVEAELATFAPVSMGNPEVILLQSANRKLVNQALEELPVGYREVIVMREIEDMSYKDIASVAGIPLGTVMSRLSRGRELLKTAIENRLRRAS